MTFLGRLLAWLVDVVLQLALLVLRPASLMLSEVLTVTVRAFLYVFSNPEAWAVTAVVLLWLFTNRSTLPSIIAATAIIATLSVTFVRSRL